MNQPLIALGLGGVALWYFTSREGGAKKQATPPKSVDGGVAGGKGLPGALGAGGPTDGGPATSGRARQTDAEREAILAGPKRVVKTRNGKSRVYYTSEPTELEAIMGGGTTNLKFIDLRYLPASGRVVLEFERVKTGERIERSLDKPYPAWIEERLTIHLIEEADTYIKSLAKSKAHELKCKGAAALNSYAQSKGVQAGVTCDDSVKEAVNKVAAATGGALGAGACAATGVGTAVVPLCGMAGSIIGQYLGPKIGDVLEKAWKKTGSAIKKAWNKIF